MQHTLEAYKTAIVDWNNERSNAATLLKLLKTGNYFEITRAMYNNWTPNSPENIHAYVGVDSGTEDSLGFMLIDSVNDSDPSTVTAANIAYAPYLEGFDTLLDIPEFSNVQPPDSNITVLEALERSYRWMLNRKKYIENKVAEGAGENAGMFQGFHIPMGDFDSIFSDVNTDKALVVIGLQEDNTTAELILWNKNFSIDQVVEDVSYPIPPFGQGNYNLLTMSLNL